MNPIFFKKVDEEIKFREQLESLGFTPYDNGEYLIQSDDEKVVLWVIPGQYWSVEIYYNVAGTSILNATIPVSNIHEIKEICNQNDIKTY